MSLPDIDFKKIRLPSAPRPTVGQCRFQHAVEGQKRISRVVKSAGLPHEGECELTLRIRFRQVAHNKVGRERITARSSARGQKRHAAAA